MSFEAGGLNEDTTPTGDGEKTGVASSAGGLDENAPQGVLAEEPPVMSDDMELHYYRLHKASFNMQAFPPSNVRTSNTKFKHMIQIDPIRNVVHTWSDYSDREKNNSLTEEEQKLLLSSSKPTRQATSGLG